MNYSVYDEDNIHVNVKGIARVERCVAEFDVWELQKTPFSKFKVKIIESTDGIFTGYTNLILKNLEDGSPDGEAGHGATVEEALENTLKYFMEMLNERQELTEDDFEWADPDDF
ncbi:hypothetical protein [Numidum massiliense]|uniref:hypothetical protein n=1 Tax=Numidum massiliense TaxID=1522315 RepID=UPI0006D52C3D|nr:hypothetical protein [Numidum massiliense]